jgi:hypothetical protein
MGYVELRKISLSFLLSLLLLFPLRLGVSAVKKLLMRTLNDFGVENAFEEQDAGDA